MLNDPKEEGCFDMKTRKVVDDFGSYANRHPVYIEVNHSGGIYSAEAKSHSGTYYGRANATSLSVLLQCMGKIITSVHTRRVEE